MLVVLVAAVATWWLASGQYFGVPRVAGLSVASARSELSNAGLVPAIGGSRHSDNVAAGEVISTDPSAGARVKHGERVMLITSLGPILVTVPNVTGQSVANAEQALSAAGLSFAKPTYQTSTVQAGIVISTSPTPYQQWPKNKPVRLIVSAGPPLPNFVGGLLTAAQSAASAGGYTIAPQTLASSSQPPNTIVSQSPAARHADLAGRDRDRQRVPGPPQVAVPDVTGMSAQQAIQALRGAGFQVQEQGGGFGGGGGTVTSYSPTGQAPQGSTITIVVNFGI